MCCASLGELPYSPLPLNQTWLATLTGDSPAFEFESGKSYFAAYRLPESSDPVKITFRAELSERTFHPAILLLDADFKIAQLIEKNGFGYKPGFLGSRGALETSITILPIASIRYLVVLTTKELLADATMLGDGAEIPIIIPTASGVILMPVRSGPFHQFIERTYYYHGPMGKIQITTEKGTTS